MRLLELEDGEDIINEQNVIPQDVWDDIKSKCTMALKPIMAGAGPLYRGYRKDRIPTEPIFTGKSPTNRIPVDMPLYMSEKIDNYLSEQGFTAIRSNSIFVGSLEMAMGYGITYDRIYIILPMDGFSYTWSPEVPDLWEKFDKAKVELMSKLKNEDPNIKDWMYLSDKDKKEKIMDIIFDHVFDTEYNINGLLGTYKNTDYDQIPYAGCEVMIHGNYYAINAKRYSRDLIAKAMKK